MKHCKAENYFSLCQMKNIEVLFISSTMMTMSFAILHVRDVYCMRGVISIDYSTSLGFYFKCKIVYIFFHFS